MTGWLWLIFLLGLAVRYGRAWDLVWHPDDALHYLIARQGDWWRESLPDNHPPLYYGMLHWVLRVSDADWAQRSVGIVAGSLTPLVVYQWLKERGEEVGGWLALGVLALSPNLVDQSCQLRGYVPALFLASVALLFLERALREGSGRWMAASGVMLYLTLLTEHNGAFAAVALGMYGVVRWGEMGRTLRKAWVGVQVGGVGVAAAIAWWIVKPYRGYVAQNAAGEGYLAGGVWQDGQNPWRFAVKAVGAQFAYLGSGLEMGVLLGLLGLVGVWAAGRQGVLVGVPLGMGVMLGMLKWHPFGYSRHSMMLGLFCIAGAGWGWNKLLKDRMALGRGLAAGVAVAMCLLVKPHHQVVEGEQAKKSLVVVGMKQGLAALPAGAKLLTDRETALLLRVYLGKEEPGFTRWDMKRSFRIGPKRIEVMCRRWGFRAPQDVEEDVRRLGLAGREVWVMDGGFQVMDGVPERARRLGPRLVLYRFGA
jgi:hypothetical protein